MMPPSKGRNLAAQAAMVAEAVQEMQDFRGNKEGDIQNGV